METKIKMQVEEKYRMESSDEMYYFPRRFILVALGFFGMFNVYAMRVNLSVAMVAMVNTTSSNSYSNESFEIVECPMLLKYGTETPKENFKGDQYNWNAKTQSAILGSFFYGYILTQLPGGIMSEQFGAKWLFGGGILVTAVFSLVTPLAASWGTAAFITVRVIEGLGEGVTFPAINAAISRWSPKVERSRISTIIFTGSQMGNVVSMPISGWLSSTDFLGGWPSVFYVFGTIGCVWFVLWSIFIHETPDSHPNISQDELHYIKQNQDEKENKRNPIPWKSIFTSLPMWAVIVAHFGHNFGFLILLTELPTYLSEILHFNITANGILSALPYIVQAFTAWIASFIADRLRASNVLSITNIRKICNSIGLFGPAICLLGVTMSGCQPKIIVALFSLAMGLNGFIYSGFNITHVDMSPDYAATLFGITNAISNVSGVLGPWVVGVFTSKGQTIGNWSDVFYITAAVYTVCAVFYAIFASAELQPWGIASNKSSLEKTKSSEVKLQVIGNKS